MPDIPVGTYPYHKRHAIMEAVQAGLLPHTRLDGDEDHQGCVTVLIRVTAPQEPKFVAEGDFKCPKCGGRYFGSWLHKRADGTWVVLSRRCHDEHGLGCQEVVAMEPTPANPVTPQDYIDAKHPLAKHNIPPERARGCATKVTG